ncbi:MAG: PEP-utilizing enzyme [Candidatus Woesearchaeota archaeon]
MIDDYYNIKIKKMGRWTLTPADSESWHGEHSAKYFKELFGFGKGTLVIHTLDDGYQFCYYPGHFFKKLYKYIKDTNEEDYLKLANILKTFYPLREQARKDVPKINPKNFKALSNEKLIEVYEKNRDWTHRITVYDQFGWIAEDYWNPVMESILVNKHEIKKDSKEYFDVLFCLTKPEEISTTLSEKRDVLLETIKVKKNEKSVDEAAKGLANKYGFMPVFAYGTPWDAEYYKTEVKEILQKDLSYLETEYQILKDYVKIRNNDINEMVKKYNIIEKDLQIFIDFGLALDTRNEAEYILSLTGFYLLPVYDEISKRLNLSVREIRNLCEDDIINSLLGKVNPQEILDYNENIRGWGFDKEMLTRYDFTPEEAHKMFEYLEKNAENLHGNEEHKGKCASKGKVSGKAKIVLGPEENYKVKEGDVLITHATTVDYLPAMKKAVAFVTEVGGLTCHAAVVAREFGVPCVVGLKDATKNFKDNDLVEVDADKGIVRKIS